MMMRSNNFARWAFTSQDGHVLGQYGTIYSV